MIKIAERNIKWAGIEGGGEWEGTDGKDGGSPMRAGEWIKCVFWVEAINRFVIILIIISEYYKTLQAIFTIHPHSRITVYNMCMKRYFGDFIFVSCSHCTSE